MDAVAGEGALVEQLHGGHLEDGDEVLAHARQVLVVVTPLEGRRGDGGVVGLGEGGRHGGVREVLGVERERPQALAALDGEDLDGVGVVAIVAGGDHVVLLG